MILPTAQVFVLAPSLGLTVAVCDESAQYGFLSPSGTRYTSQDPSPDLRTVKCPDPKFVDCEPLTPDGHAFLQLVGAS